VPRQTAFALRIMRVSFVKSDCPVLIYDLNRVLCKSLAGAEISTIHLSTRPNSALFVGQSTDCIVTTDFSNRVQLWKHDKDSGNWIRTELFHGEHPIYYAETNAEGTQLLIIEDASGGNSDMQLNRSKNGMTSEVVINGSAPLLLTIRRSPSRSIGRGRTSFPSSR
jgi:hypothetical protein